MRLFRHLVIAVVALALPVQGYAAVAMVACGPVHARVAGASHDPAAGAHASHDHAAHDHAAGAMAVPATTGEASAAHHGIGCSACASCCSGSAASSPPATLAGFVAAHLGAIPFSSPSEQSVVPEGLERPPRVFPV
jgi:hypothetical protein